LVRLTHEPEQAVWPVGQLNTHWLFEQSCPDAHLLLQAPQLLRSLVRFWQIPEQLVRPEGQVHLLLAQIMPPVHLVPQVPQLLGSLVVSTQEPEQAVCPVGQLNTQRLFEQS
jgi:hypothetical protein